MTFPGFVSLYKDDNNKTHIYFFKGLTESMRPIYKNLDLSKIKFPYKFTEYPDKAIDYVFNDDIKTVHCDLIEAATGNKRSIKISLT